TPPRRLSAIRSLSGQKPARPAFTSVWGARVSRTTSSGSNGSEPTSWTDCEHVRRIHPPAGDARVGARALAVLSRAAERRSTHRRVRGVSSPGAAHDEDRGRVGAARRAALRALARRPSIAGLARPYVARTHLHPAHRRGARRHAGARARARDDRCAPWRRRARDPLVPRHAWRAAPPSRLR